MPRRAGVGVVDVSDRLDRHHRWEQQYQQRCVRSAYNPATTRVGAFHEAVTNQILADLAGATDTLGFRGVKDDANYIGHRSVGVPGLPRISFSNTTIVSAAIIMAELE